MVKKINKTQLDSLLEAGAITPKEYGYLLKSSGKKDEEESEKQEEPSKEYGYLLKSSGKKDEEESEKQEEPSVAKNIVSFILTIIAIGVVLFGTCIMNLAIVGGMRLDALTPVLMIAWPLFPVVLFGWIAHKTKNAGMKWAVIFLAIGALLFITEEMMG